MSRALSRFAAAVGLLGAPVASAAPAVGQAPREGRQYALLVGVRQYVRGELTEVPFAEADVEELAQVLLEAGYPKDNVVVLTQKRGAADADLLPTGANVREQLKLLLQGRTAEDSVLVAFAGHGIQYKETEDNYFCPMDARPARPETLLGLREVYAALKDSRAGFKLLLVDACRDKPLPRGSRAGDDVESATRPQKVPPPGGVASLFSCSAGQKAYENDKLGHGVFFHYVIQGLRGQAGTDQATDVTLADLVAYVGREVPDFVRTQHRAAQVPELVGQVRGSVPLVRLQRPPVDRSKKGSLGVQLQSLSARLARRLGLEGVSGVRVRGVLSGSAAEKGGLHRDDVIVTADGEAVTGAAQLAAIVNGQHAGSSLTLEFLRGGKRQRTRAFLTEKPAEAALAEAYRQAAENGEAWAQFALGELYLQGQGVAQDAAEGARWVRKAAEQGESDAQAELGLLYAQGTGVAEDAAEALRWYRKAAEQDDPTGQVGLGDLYADGRGVEKDEAEALRWYRKAAEQGDAPGQNKLGLIYKFGRGVARDDAEAVRWYRKAADQGHADAEMNLGWMYAHGQGVAQDDTEALRWYRLAADQGWAPAENNLGWMYANGRGVEKDEAEAVKWYRRSAERNDASGQNSLGRMYEDGRGVEKDDAEAVNWYRKAAEQDYPGGQLNLGRMYANGRGVEKDEAEAVKWYRKAADQDDADAQYNLGRMYEEGRGMDKDEAEAVKWYRKAADQDDADAQYRLGVMYETGKGVEQDLDEAVKWYRKAAEQEHEDARAALKRLDKEP